MLAQDRLVLFGPEHLATLFILALLATFLSLAVRRAPRHSPVQRRICWAVAAVTVAGAIFKQIYEAATGTWSAQLSLPLHVCDIAVFVVAAALVLAVETARPSPCAGHPASMSGRQRRAQRLYEVAYYWGLGGTVQALLTPDVTEPFPHPVFFRYFITHGGIVVGVIVMTFGLRMRPRPKSWRWLWVLTLALAIAMLGIDGLLGANYMFLCHPPEHPSIIDYLGKWPWSLLSLAALGTGLLLFWYSPWWLIDRVRRRTLPPAPASSESP